MGVMVAVQNGTLLRTLRVLLQRRVSARREGDYSKVLQAIQKKNLGGANRTEVPKRISPVFFSK
jgi:hypothetical protein